MILGIIGAGLKLKEDIKRDLSSEVVVKKSELPDNRPVVPFISLEVDLRVVLGVLEYFDSIIILLDVDDLAENRVVL